jgi:hypothetical protein
MPKFRVVLYDASQGTLDVYANQRTVWATGPDGVNRELRHGDVFDGPTFWKQYAKPRNGAFLEVIDDSKMKALSAVSSTQPTNLLLNLAINVRVNGNKIY